MTDCGLNRESGTEVGFGWGFNLNWAETQAKRDARRAATAAGRAWVAAQAPCPDECDDHMSRGFTLRNTTITGRGWAFIPIFLWFIPVFFIPVRTATASSSWYGHVICARSRGEVAELVGELQGWLGT